VPVGVNPEDTCRVTAADGTRNSESRFALFGFVRPVIAPQKPLTRPSC
jgi:hypothetical protein